ARRREGIPVEELEQAFDLLLSLIVLSERKDVIFGVVGEVGIDIVALAETRGHLTDARSRCRGWYRSAARRPAARGRHECCGLRSQSDNERSIGGRFASKPCLPSHNIRHDDRTQVCSDLSWNHRRGHRSLLLASVCASSR